MTLRLAGAVAVVCTTAAQASAQSPTTQSVGPSTAPSAPLTESEPAATDEASEGLWIFPSRPPVFGPLVTDRPGFSDSVSLVPRGYTQFEFGYTFTLDESGSDVTRNHLIGEYSLRTGLTDWSELRVKWSGLSLTESQFDTTSRWAGRRIRVTDHDDGPTDMSVGFKLPLLEQDGFIPNLSIIPAISIPTGAGGKSSGDVDPEVRFAWNRQLTNEWSVYGVALLTSLSDSDGRYFQSGASLATYYQFTDKLGGFVEYYGLYPGARDNDCQHSLDFGPVILINENFQIDIRAGFGLNDDAPDFFTGIGFSFRF